MKDWLAVIGFVLLLAVIAASAVLWFRGPCWVYKYEKAGETPARCLMADR